MTFPTLTFSHPPVGYIKSGKSSPKSFQRVSGLTRQRPTWQWDSVCVISRYGNITPATPHTARVFSAHGRDQREGFYIIMQAGRERVKWADICTAYQKKKYIYIYRHIKIGKWAEDRTTKTHTGIHCVHANILYTHTYILIYVYIHTIIMNDIRTCKYLNEVTPTYTLLTKLETCLAACKRWKH